MTDENHPTPMPRLGILQRCWESWRVLCGVDSNFQLRRDLDRLRAQLVMLTGTIADLRARPGVPPGPPGALDMLFGGPGDPARARSAMACRLESLSARLYSFEPWWNEVLLTISSIYAAGILFFTPGIFRDSQADFGLAMSLSADPRVWGALAVSAAASKLIGLCLTFPRPRPIGLALRILGVTISALFWFTIGLGALLGSSTNLCAMGAFLTGVWAFWALLRFPAVPS